MKLLVNKIYDKAQIFETLQGEGVFSGVPSFFIRLQGCDVRCFFCDEKQTWKHDGDFALSLNIDEILDELQQINPELKRIVITGGEPTEQDLVPFITTLIREGFNVAIETAATGKYLSWILDLKKQVPKERLWITFSPKEIYSENGKPASDKIWSLADEIKFVIANHESTMYLQDTILKKLEDSKLKTPVFLVPDWNNRSEYQDEILKILKTFPRQCRMGIQAHKFWGLL